MWSPPLPDLILDAIISTLAEREAALSREQAVYGLDSLNEVALHELLGAGLARRGLRVLREQAYPHEWRRGLRADPAEQSPASDDATSLPLPRDRQRCDLVFLPDGTTRLNDEVNRRRSARAIASAGEGMLFEQQSLADATATLAAKPANSCEPEDAFWLELKVVAQITYTAGVPGPNQVYASELTRSVSRDLTKLAGDRRIRFAAAALILFSVDEATAEHDLSIMSHRLLDRELPIQSPLRASMAIQDRVGNTRCTVFLTPLSPLTHVARTQ